MQNKTLTLGSLFDGSGGVPLGGLLAGIEPVWASEIEPFPIRVTTKRLPFMKHYGNVSEMDGGKTVWHFRASILCFPALSGQTENLLNNCDIYPHIKLAISRL